MAAPLATLLPDRSQPLSGDEILSRFVGWVASTGLALYPAQEEAILELYSSKHLVLGTPTGSGKSLVATALHFKAMAEGRTSFYTCPIKALVNEKFFALCDAFGPANVGMLTGDAGINRDAPIVCCTAEILSNLALRDGPSMTRADYVIMDEFHYYADKERGVAWQVPLISLRETTFLLMSATLGDTRAIEESLAAFTGRAVASVRSAERPVPLDFEYRETPLHETIDSLLQTGRYPIYLVNFTQRAAAEEAQSLMSVDLCTRDEKEELRRAVAEARFDTPYAKDFRRFLGHGIGLHHAGLLPKYRLLVEKLAQRGLLKVVSGTDTLGMGVNIPIRTVLFTRLCKYDGEKTAILSARDFHQIAGRAGRKGFDERGSVVVQAPEHVVDNLRLADKKAAGKKVVKKQPPQKGYVHWDRATFERLRTRAPEPLESRFEVTHGMLLNLLQNPAGGYRRLVELIARSHGNDWSRRQARRRAAACFRSLRAAGLVRLFHDQRHRHAQVEVSGDLQRDFSLNHTLSMYLVETLERLDRAAEGYALDLLSLVESILEDPQVVLWAQLDRLKTDKLDALKAAGVEYAERMEELDKLEWPKPLRDFIYDTFNAFAARHPWVGSENIRPKAIARELEERFCSFDDYVRDYGLQRSEGVLLRYLSDVYKTLAQTVPEAARTEAVDDVLAHLRALVRGVDSSLLDEWESLMRPGVPRPTVEAARAPEFDLRQFAARVRGELHRLLKALAERRYPDALAQLAPSDEEWTAEKIAAAMDEYWKEHAAIVTTPLARRPSQTVFKPLDARRFEARQRILDPEGDEDWMLDCVVEPGETGEPVVRLRGIGR
jgi:superfamily II RNA helicase